MEVLLWYSLQSLLWPVIEPVEGAAIDQGGKVSASISEDVSNRRHAHDNMEVLFNLLDVGFVDVICTLWDSLLLHEGEQFWPHAVDVFFLVKITDLTGVQDSINIL